MRSRRVVAGAGLALLLVAAGAAALYFASRRDVTTSSAEAARVFKEALDNERCFYLKEARLGYAKAIELDPNFAEALLGLARLSGDKDQSLALVRRAAKFEDRLTERERLHVEMQLADREGRREDAVKIAEQTHARYPDDQRAAMLLAAVELFKGNSDGAVKIFTDLLATNPNNPDVYNQIGYQYGYRGDMDRALANLKKYEFMLPESANPPDSLGEVLAYSGRYEEAIASLNRALKIKPDFFESWGHLGVAYEGKGETDKAVAAYLKAADLAGTDARQGDFLISALRAELCSKQKDRKAAEDIVERLGKLPKSVYSEVGREFTLAALDLIEGRPAEAQRRLTAARPKWEALDAREKRPPGWKTDSPLWNMLMAIARTAQGQDDEALPLLETLANPPNGWREFTGRRFVYEGRARLAALLARRGDLERAEKL
ncbi:MAG: tetratricopeptide repeat protein, partial [Thermoanaerobaculia bacterium]